MVVTYIHFLPLYSRYPFNTVKCRRFALDLQDGFWKRMIGFIDTLYIQLGTTDSYSAIANLHTLMLTVTHALGISVFTSRILATDL
jgi:hypothetical protein